MAYKSSKENKKTWIENIFAASYSLAKQLVKRSAKLARYNLSSDTEKIRLLRKDLVETQAKLNRLKNNKSQVSYRINMEHRNAPQVAFLEQEGLEKQYKPLLEKLERKLYNTQVKIDQLSQKNKQKQASTSKLTTALEKIDEVLEQKQSQESIYKSTELAPKQQVSLEEKIQRHYSLPSFYQDIEQTVQEYKKLSLEDRELFIQSRVAQLNDTQTPESLRVYHLATIQKLEKVENKIFYANYNESDILPSLSSDIPLVKMYANSEIIKRGEIKRTLRFILDTPHHHNHDYIREARKTLEEINLYEARQNIKKFQELKLTAKNQLEQSKKKKPKQ